MTMLDEHEVVIREEGGSSGLAIINLRKRGLAGFNYNGTKFGQYLTVGGC